MLQHLRPCVILRYDGPDGRTSCICLAWGFVRREIELIVYLCTIKWLCMVVISHPGPQLALHGVFKRCLHSLVLDEPSRAYGYVAEVKRTHVFVYHRIL